MLKDMSPNLHIQTEDNEVTLHFTLLFGSKPGVIQFYLHKFHKMLKSFKKMLKGTSYFRHSLKYSKIYFGRIFSCNHITLGNTSSIPHMTHLLRTSSNNCTQQEGEQCNGRY